MSAKMLLRFRGLCTVVVDSLADGAASSAFPVLLIDTTRVGVSPPIEPHRATLTFRAEHYVSGGATAEAFEDPAGNLLGAWPLAGREVRISTPAQVLGLRKQALSLMFGLNTGGSDGVIHRDFLVPNPPTERPLAARVLLEDGLVSCDPARRTSQGFARETDFLFETNVNEITITATLFGGASESLVLTPRGSELIEVGISNLSVPSLVPNHMHTHDRAYSALLQTPLGNLFGGDAGCQPTAGFFPRTTAST